jgi:Holliday junction resolvase RusA-like endonuclease
MIEILFPFPPVSVNKAYINGRILSPEGREFKRYVEGLVKGCFPEASVRALDIAQFHHVYVTMFAPIAEERRGHGWVTKSNKLDCDNGLKLMIDAIYAGLCLNDRRNVKMFVEQVHDPSTTETLVAILPGKLKHRKGWKRCYSLK